MQELADLAGVELQLLRVVSQRELAQARDAPSDSQLERFVEVARATSQSCREALGDRFNEDQLMLGVGSPREVAASHAAEFRASLLVIPGGELRGREITALGHATALPILVLRPRHTNARTIIAATDLSRPDYPVLRSARALAALRGARSVAVHALHKRRVAGQLDAKLHSVSRALGFDSSIVAPSRDAASVILREARRRAADVIVVGTHARSALGRAIRVSVAARVVDRSQRSVWVQPILA